jgi:hypothetical protein
VVGGGGVKTLLLLASVAVPTTEPKRAVGYRARVGWASVAVDSSCSLTKWREHGGSVVAQVSGSANAKASSSAPKSIHPASGRRERLVVLLLLLLPGW